MSERRIFFVWRGQKYSTEYRVFVEGRNVLLPDGTLLRIRAWLLNTDVIPTDIVLVETRGWWHRRKLRKQAIEAIPEAAA